MTKRILLSRAAVVIAVGILGVSTVARAADAADAPAAKREPGGAITVGATGSATVKAIDTANRTVTLQNADGDSVDIKCGKEVVNFDQIKVGDQVKAAAFARLVVAVGKPGSSDTTEATVIARAPKGSPTPGAIIARTEQVTAKVDAVDIDKQRVTLSGLDDQPQTVQVASDVDLSSVKPGDSVTLRLTRGLALWVARPSAGGAQPAAEIIRGGAEPLAFLLDGKRESATVTAIDADKRIVTLKTTDGTTHTVPLGKGAVNFDQIEVGDRVHAAVAEEVAVSVRKDGAAGAAAAAPEGARVVARAPQGNKPRVLIADTEDVVAKITAVDTDKRTITLSEADGSTRTVKASAALNLADLKAGDQATVRVTQAASIIVEKP
jgi:hypothetical protein